MGPDDIHPGVLKEVAMEFSKPLAILFNKTLKMQKVPEKWRMAHVAAIFNKGVKNDPQNYRPISLTSVVTCNVCTIFESILRDHII